MSLRPKWLVARALVILSIGIVLSPELNQVQGQASPRLQSVKSVSNEQLTQILLQQLLDEAGDGQIKLEDRKAVEDTIFAKNDAPFPQVKNRQAPIRRYLDEAKDQLEVIDFHRNPESSEGHIRQPRRRLQKTFDDELLFGDELALEKLKAGSASEPIPTTLEFPGNEFARDSRAIGKSKHGCTNCIEGEFAADKSRWTMPLQRLGEKQFYLGIFFKANWYKAEQYCRFHGMHLASINSAEEQQNLQDHVQAYGMGQEHFWTSGTDQGEEGKFFWLATGKPITYVNWNAGEPNNFQHEDGEQEHCLEMWDRDGKGMGWNDTPCSFETFFICEV